MVYLEGMTGCFKGNCFLSYEILSNVLSRWSFSGRIRVKLLKTLGFDSLRSWCFSAAFQASGPFGEQSLNLTAHRGEAIRLSLFPLLIQLDSFCTIRWVRAIC